MDTPICDFVRAYAGSGTARLHMPGHKGAGPLGMEQLDITEISGADSLYEAGGIIQRSEKNASSLFGCPTFYSAEGSSQCIRAMLYLVALHAKGRPVIAAARNVHKTFLTAAALLDLEVRWIYPPEDSSYLSCPLEESSLEAFLRREQPTALYITSPDYLGNISDIQSISRICHKNNILLLVDNAHGAYLRFLHPSRHPMDLGADLCCDSAHKTLPVLTGGAYLHISEAAPVVFRQRARDALALFGSTSPSYLILQSLDSANAYLSDGYTARLAAFSQQIQQLKQALSTKGWEILPGEPLKITVCAKASGYTGTELSELLRQNAIECEFSDPDYLVLMLTPENGKDIPQLTQAFDAIPQKPPIEETPPPFHRCEQVLSLRQALFSNGPLLPVEECIGKVLISPCVGCPPAVPILICGERIDEEAAARFRYYGIKECAVENK